MQKFLRLYEEGAIQPIKPIKIFDAVEVEDAFRYMQKGTHMGKVVVRMPADPEDLTATATPRELVLRSDASYLMVGGLGGLGQSVSTWMAEHGAKNLIYLSRSAGTTERDKIFIKELEGYGCNVQMFPGSVSVLADVENVVQNAAKPIAGVMQMSMVLRVSVDLAWSISQAYILMLLFPGSGFCSNLYRRLEDRSGSQDRRYLESS